MDKNTIEPSKKTVHELFQSSSSLFIPKYQRPFSWGSDEAEELYNDILKGNPDYFLGNILLNRKSSNVLEVIDGQQRITSLSLLFLALYLYCEDKKIKDASKIKNYLEKGNFGSSTNSLKLSKINNELYERLLSAKTIAEIASLVCKNDSDKKIIDVITTFINLIKKDKKEDDNLETQRITEIFRRISENVFFIVIIAENNKQASKLFEVLNNKGVDLTEADLVRNYLLSKADQQSFESSIETWENLEKKIGIDNLEQFLRYSSLLVSEADGIYERVFEYAEKHSSKTAIDFFNDSSDFYLKILDPGSYNEDSDTTLEELNTMNITQVRPLLLAASRKFDTDTLVDLSKTLVNFVFRYSVICGKNPNKVELFSKDTSFNVYNGLYTYADVCRKISELNPDDQDFKKAFLEKNFKNTKIPRYILGKIEDKMSSGEKSIDFSAVHLEHIMPKKISKWQTADPYYNEEFHLKYVNQLGNMVLLSQKINTKIKNSLFVEKKDNYGGSDIHLIDEIKKKTVWKKEEIEWNINRYYQVAKEIWKIEESI